MEEGRSWLVLVGGRRRLGRALAESLSRDFDLVLTSGRPWDDEEDWIKELSRAARVRTCCWHAAEPSLVPQMMADLERLRADGITPAGAVLLPALFPEDPLGSWTPEGLAELWQVNLSFPLLAAQTLLPTLLPGGCLQLVLDSCIHRPFGRRLPYSASKAGLAALVPGLARLAAPQVRVVGHAIGTLLPAEGSDVDGLGAATLRGEVGEPEDLARAVRFAQASPHLTGEILTLDGGWRWR